MNEDNPNPTATEPEAGAAKPAPSAHVPNPYEVQRRESQRRLRELLAIPERDRTDEIWDKIVDLEIELAPGNRVNSPPIDPGRRHDGGQRHDNRQQKNGGKRQGQGQGQGQGLSRHQDQGGHNQDRRPGQKPGKRFFKKKGRRGGGPGPQQPQ